MPRVTVAMSVHNGERFLREAIDSVLAQTFRDFEFLIVDDGSTDATPEILSSYRDGRVTVVTNDGNQGLTRSLNKILARARGEYVARMDADDVSMPKRLEKQVAYLDRHPRIGLVGTRIERIDERGTSLGIPRAPTSPALLRWCMLFANPLIHSSVMVRRDLVSRAGGYDERLRYAQDYDLWSRLAFEAGVANIGEALLRLRRHGGSISASHGDQQRRVCDQVWAQAAQRLLGETVPAERMAAITAVMREAALSRPLDAGGAIVFLLCLYRRYCEQWRPTARERLATRFDLARRLVALGGRALDLDPGFAGLVLRRALRCDPRVALTRLFWRTSARLAWHSLKARTPAGGKERVRP